MSNIGGLSRKINASISSKFNYDDETWGIVWAKSDLQEIQNQFKKIRMMQERGNFHLASNYIFEFEHQVKRSQNDQTSDYEPLSVSVKKDRVPNAGRTQAAFLITGWSVRTFDFMAVGTSQVNPTDGDYKLLNEIGRVSSRTSGFVGPAGSIIKHTASFPVSMPTLDYWEVSPVDTDTYSEDQNIWARAVFPAGKAVHHDINEDFFTIHHSCYTTSSL